MDRRDKLLRSIDRNGKGLEIGPSHAPIAPKKDGFDVEIIDHAPAEELIRKYGELGVDTSLVEAVIGEPVKMAKPNFVREQTGYVIGGVPPIGHLKKITTLIDEDLLQYAEIWAAAGTPFAVFRLTPQELLKLCGENLVRVH